MSDLIVLAFENEEGSFQARDRLIALQKEGLITLADAAIVTRKADGRPKVKQLHSMVGPGAVGGAFWGMLIGLLFFAPWLGLAAGALSGALAGKFTDIGIDDSFIKEVGETIEPGHSALFLLVYTMTEDKVIPELRQYTPKVLRTNLSNEDEAKLRDAFGASEE